MPSAAVDVAVLIGSLRKDAFSRRLADAIAQLAPAPLRLAPVEIRDLPLYDADLEEAPPAPWVRFRERIRAADAILFVTPEYNRSVPGALKNAIDVGSRPAGHGAWRDRPGAVVSLSQGALGGFGAAHHLRQSMVTVGVPMLAVPEVHVSRVADVFDDDGALVPATREVLGRFLAAFASWIDRLAPAR